MADKSRMYNPILAVICLVSGFNTYCDVARLDVSEPVNANNTPFLDVSFRDCEEDQQDSYDCFYKLKKFDWNKKNLFDSLYIGNDE